jgi:ABC-2 type transport system permease protein
MSWLLVARQRLRESWRSRELPSYVVVFAAVFGAIGAFYARVVAPDGGGTSQFLSLPVLLSIPLVPAVGILLGNDVVAGPREDGRLRLLLGQPVSRTDVVGGGYAAKAVVLLATFAAAGVATLLVTALLGTTFPADVLARLLLLAAGLGVAYLGIAVAASATFRTTSATTVATFGAFLLFVVFWRFIPDGVAYAANGFEPLAATPPWVDLANGLSPSLAFEYLVDAYLEAENVPSGPTHYDEPLIYVGVLLWWGVALPALAAWRFAGADL